MGQDRGGSSIGGGTYLTGDPRATAVPASPATAKATLDDYLKGKSLADYYRAIGSGDVKALREFQDIASKFANRDVNTNYNAPVGMQTGSTPTTELAGRRVSTDENAVLEDAYSKGILQKGNDSFWHAIGTVAFSPPVLAAVGAYGLQAAAGGSAAAGGADTGTVLANGTIDVAGEAGGAGSAVASMGAYPGTAAIGGAAAGTVATGSSPTTTPAGSAGIGAGTDAGNVAATAPAAGGASTAAKSLATVKAISEYGSAAMTIGSLIGGGSGGVDVPSPDAPEAPPSTQSAKEPDYAGIRQKVPGGLSSGNLSTLLTGASGIDPSTLMLGKSLLLGS